jgi:hypothetical protein
MRVNYLVYDSAGRVHHFGHHPHPFNVRLESFAGVGLSLLALAAPVLYAPKTHYVDPAQAEYVGRPELAPALDRLQVSADPARGEFVTLSDLPVPCRVRVGGRVEEVDEGGLELSFDTPGTYQVRVEAWPFQDWEASIEAT